LTLPVKGLNQASSSVFNVTSLSQIAKGVLGVLGEVADLILLISLANQRAKSVLLLIS
jgi:hypothetical protein